MAQELCNLSAHEISRLVRSGEVKAGEVLEANLELVRFRFIGSRLMEEKAFKLGGTEVIRW